MGQKAARARTYPNDLGKDPAGGFEHQQESAVRIRTGLLSIQLLFAIPMRLPQS